jgi:putative oxidoreductase
MAQADPSYARPGFWPHANKALLVLRVVVGLLFVGHGGQKLFGWFGGDGIDAFAGSLTRAGIQSPRFWAYFEASAEMAAGAMLALGLLTPLAVAVLIGDMAFAAIKVHAPRGFWNQGGGFEYPLVLITILLAIGLAGSGRYSLDYLLGLSLPRPHTLIAALVVSLLLVGALLLGLL